MSYQYSSRGILYCITKYKPLVKKDSEYHLAIKSPETDMVKNIHVVFVIKFVLTVSTKPLFEPVRVS